MTTATRRKALTMNVELSVIENLGFRMYTTLPAVIAELVANAWDAEATEVDVKVENPSEGIHQVSVIDNGLGMNWDEVRDAYLTIGLKRRDLHGDRSAGDRNRLVMGRKGIGKLSAFGIAKEIEVLTVQDHLATHFLMSISGILDAANRRVHYRPRLQKQNGRRLKKEHGTRVILKEIRRRTPIDVEDLRRSLARRFSVIGADFVVAVNGRPITPEERDLQAKCEFVWKIPGKLPGQVSGDHDDWQIAGWLGTCEKPVPDSVGAGVVIMARGKLIQEPFDFNPPAMEGQHVRSYLVGEIHAEFMDQALDLVTSYRGAVLWQSEQGEALKRWGKETVTRVGSEWVQKRRARNTSKVMAIQEFRGWYSGLKSPDRRKMDRILNVVVTEKDDNPLRTRALLHYVVQAFDYLKYSDLVEELEGLPPQKAHELFKLFQEWQLIEAREVFKVIEGRYKAIVRLDDLVNADAREVPEIHNFLAENPWIIEPTWTLMAHEASYAALVKKQFPETKTPVARKRLDLFSVGVSGTLHVVELKRARVVVGIDEIAQVEKYIGFVRKCLSTSPKRVYREVQGHLLGETMDEEGRMTLENHPRVTFLAYKDILASARNIYKEIIGVLKKMPVDRPELVAFAKDAEVMEKIADGADGQIAATIPKPDQRP